jgi:peptidylamidoglycolate lyase
MLLAAYDAVESLASLSSRVESRFRSDKKRTLKSAPVVGHNGFRYRVHSDWGIPDEPSRYPVKDCHEMVVDSLGRIVLLTNHQKNNILIYNADGQIVDSWTLGFRSAHGLSLIHEQGRDVLFICDYRSQSVVKTDMNGNILMRLPTAGELGIYEEPYKYLPTGTAIASNGDIYVADGYGASFVIQFDRHGDYIRHFGGRGKKPEHINQAHGIAIDGRSIKHAKA